MGGVRGTGARAGGRPVAGFALAELTGDVAELVRPEPPADGLRRALLVRPAARAVVLGSAQRADALDLERCAAAGVAVVQRRSGGGAVVVAPDAQVWLDVFVPASDPRADADVARAAFWLGDLWAAAIASLTGGTGLAVHRGGVVAGRFSRTACFSGLGPGEVTLDGRKVVGCSQRRTRAGTWLHTMALLSNEQVTLADLLVLAPLERVGLAATLAETVGVVSGDRAVLEARLAALLAAC